MSHDFREKCESLCFDLGGPTSMCPSAHRPYVEKIEAFACEIRNQALEEAAKEAEATSHLATQPGNRFDEGYSQGRFEAGSVIRALKEQDCKHKSVNLDEYECNDCGETP